MSSTSAPQTVARPRIDLGSVMKNAGQGFIDDILPLIVGTLIAIVLSVLTLGILAGPLYAGLTSMFIRRRDEGRPAQIGDVFSQMHRFWAFFGAALALVILIGLASITIIGGILLAAIWMYVFPLMVERGMGLGEAMRESRELVSRAGFWEHVVLVILLAVIGALGRGPLVLLTIPFGIAVVTGGYFESRTGPEAPQATLLAPPAPPAPPVAG